MSPERDRLLDEKDRLEAAVRDAEDKAEDISLEACQLEAELIGVELRIAELDESEWLDSDIADRAWHGGRVL